VSPKKPNKQINKKDNKLLKIFISYFPIYIVHHHLAFFKVLCKNIQRETTFETYEPKAK
jgi:hypothetical protein